MRLGLVASFVNCQTECVLSCEINPDSRHGYQKILKEIPLGDIREIESLPPHNILSHIP